MIIASQWYMHLALVILWTAVFCVKVGALNLDKSCDSGCFEAERMVQMLQNAGCFKTSHSLDCFGQFPIGKIVCFCWRKRWRKKKNTWIKHITTALGGVFKGHHETCCFSADIPLHHHHFCWQIVRTRPEMDSRSKKYFGDRLNQAVISTF